jgi:hypothetical protein
MPITDPQAIKFSNEAVRVMAERFRSLKVDVDAILTQWFGGINALFPNNGTLLDDGRTVDGVSVLTGADVTNLITQLLEFQTQMNGVGVVDVISKPCVRTLITG